MPSSADFNFADLTPAEQRLIRRQRRSRRQLPASMKIEQDPHMLVAFDRACVSAFRRWVGFDVPKAVVVRAFERLLIHLADDIDDELPRVCSVFGGRPALQDRDRWERVEIEIGRQLLAMARRGIPAHQAGRGADLERVNVS